MKRLWIVTTVVLVLACGLARAQGAPEGRIGVFDAARLSDETAEGKAVGAQLTALQEKKRAELAAKQKEIGDLQNQLTTQALSLSPERRSQMEKEINMKGLELQQLQQKAQNEMQMELQEAQARSGMRWAGALAMGMGGSLGGYIRKLPGGGKQIIDALDMASESLANGGEIPAEATRLFAKPLMPRWMYLLFGNIGWRMQMRRNKARRPISYRPHPQD